MVEHILQCEVVVRSLIEEVLQRIVGTRTLAHMSEAVESRYSHHIQQKDILRSSWVSVRLVGRSVWAFHMLGKRLCRAQSFFHNIHRSWQNTSFSFIILNVFPYYPLENYAIHRNNPPG